MGRLSTAESMMRLLSTPDQAHERLEDACLDVHRICMTLISRSIELEIRPGNSQPENMSLLLACAQMTQSVSTLSRVRSECLLQVLNACADVCRACASSCAEAKHLGQAEECSQACLRCAESCLNFLRLVPIA